MDPLGILRSSRYEQMLCLLYIWKMQVCIITLIRPEVDSPSLDGVRIRVAASCDVLTQAGQQNTGNSQNHGRTGHFVQFIDFCKPFIRVPDIFYRNLFWCAFLGP